MEEKIKYFFLDDNRIEQKNGLVLCYGGYFYEGKLMDLFNRINNTKEKLDLEIWMPIKWDFSDAVMKYYQKHCSVEDFESYWMSIKDRSEDIRQKLLLEVLEDLKLIFSFIYTSKNYNRDEIRNWMIENLFQRIGLNMSKNCLNMIICDYEHEKSDTKKVLEKEYYNAFYDAENYFSGPFSKRGAFPALCYSSTYCNPFLQISDLIVGCMGKIIRCWVNKQNVDNFTKGIFSNLKTKFIKDSKTDNIFKFGIISQPNSLESFRKFLIGQEMYETN